MFVITACVVTLPFPCSFKNIAPSFPPNKRPIPELFVPCFDMFPRGKGEGGREGGKDIITGSTTKNNYPPLGCVLDAVMVIETSYADGFRYYADGFLRWALLGGISVGRF